MINFNNWAHQLQKKKKKKPGMQDTCVSVSWLILCLPYLISSTVCALINAHMYIKSVQHLKQSFKQAHHSYGLLSWFLHVLFKQ